MNIRISTEELVRALSKVQGIVERRSTNPIIANVLLETVDGRLRVTATDTQVGLTADYPAEIKTEGRITVAARPLFEIVRSMPTDAIDLVLEEDLLKVRGGQSDFELRVLPADEFPPVPSFDGDPSFKLTAKNLRELIELTSFAISTDETRMGLNGAHLETEETETGRILLMVATDGHRLSRASRPVEGGDELPDILVARKGLMELKRVLDNDETEVEARREGSQLLFRWGSTTFVTRLLEGRFPDFRKVVPKDLGTDLRIDRGQLLSALKRVSVLAPEKSNAVRVEVTADGVVLQSRHSELGSARIPIEAQVDGKELEIGFNARYFRDVLSVLGSEEITMGMRDALSPTLVKPCGDEQVLFVVMPMRLE
jgi:DNA polymerase-3 subunit beta